MYLLLASNIFTFPFDTLASTPCMIEVFKMSGKTYLPRLHYYLAILSTYLIHGAG